VKDSESHTNFLAGNQLRKQKTNPGVVLHACDTSTLEADAGKS
jgi:hypothetical protein